MKTEYNEIEISYDEGRDRWLFELRGRSRSADSLAKAKEAIDKEPAEKRQQTFPRFQAYFWRYDDLKVVTVTSIAEEASYGKSKVFWVMDKDNRRSKELQHSLFPVNEHNTKIIEAVKAKEAEVEKLQEDIRALRETLQQATVPAEVAA